EMTTGCSGTWAAARRRSSINTSAVEGDDLRDRPRDDSGRVGIAPELVLERRRQLRELEGIEIEVLVEIRVKCDLHVLLAPRDQGADRIDDRSLRGLHSGDLRLLHFTRSEGQGRASYRQR